MNIRQYDPGQTATKTFYPIRIGPLAELSYVCMYIGLYSVVDWGVGDWGSCQGTKGGAPKRDGKAKITRICITKKNIRGHSREIIDPRLPVLYTSETVYCVIECLLNLAFGYQNRINVVVLTVTDLSTNRARRAVTMLMYAKPSCEYIHQSVQCDAGFLSLLGVVFLGVTTTILLVVPEQPDQDLDDQSSVLETYQNVICVSCLPAVRTLLLCLLTVKVPQS